jgi:hypothetical protein
MEALKNKRFNGKMKCLPLWPSYIGEKGRTLGKTYEIKVNWEHPWEAPWELEGNMLGTCWEQSPSPPPPSKLKRKKKTRHFECMLTLCIG